MKNQKTVKIVHSPKQRLFGVLALVALFGCGVMLGVGMNENKQVTHDSAFTEIQCYNLRSNIANNAYPNVEVLEQMYEIYNENCAGREFDKPVQSQPEENLESKKPCEQIEILLLEKLWPADGVAETRIERAKLYAQISERGCPENSQKYENMAKQELEIARALADDVLNEYETIEVVETYKRLNMQAAAEEILETAKKLTNPAIDFILEVEKIINEQ